MRILGVVRSFRVVLACVCILLRGLEQSPPLMTLRIDTKTVQQPIQNNMPDFTMSILYSSHYSH
jgi:hypothetical protein